MGVVKLEVTNSVNDDKDIEWFFYNSETIRDEWKKEKEEEQNKWNYHTQGAMSFRYYSFDDHMIDELLEFGMDYFEGMKLKDFLTLMKNISL